ncbi:MAG: hypothetical protein D6719_00405 [Candidatus Dadabacteria bacterium]|nr:MAG: hypothetical protein D6719_00405 [Candidatus Dadabacteria bacterium]
MLKKTEEYIAFGLVKLLVVIFALPPAGFSRRFLYVLLRVALLFQPRYRRIAMTNIGIAFPDLDKRAREKIYTESCYALARFLVDALRAPLLSREWMEDHVKFPAREELEKIKASGRPVLFATGHLGSFELMAHYYAKIGYSIHYVVRNFKNKALDKWWIEKRESSGNKVINRKGAFKEMIKALKRGQDVGALIDQNVTRNHAVFVDFFGLAAATTKAFALAALREKPVIAVASMTCVADENYIFNVEFLDFDELYERDDMTKGEKIFKITSVVTKKFEEMIRNNPGEWLWFHRRWKTRPAGESENVYA